MDEETQKVLFSVDKISRKISKDITYLKSEYNLAREQYKKNTGEQNPYTIEEKFLPEDFKEKRSKLSEMIESCRVQLRKVWGRGNEEQQSILQIHMSSVNGYRGRMLDLYRIKAA